MQAEFSGSSRLYSATGIARLQAAKVTVIGIGGVGSWVVEALARTAIGTIQLIDLDDICVTNTNRQLPAMKGNIGKLKVDVMKERVKLINEQCHVESVVDFLTVDNISEYIDSSNDYIVDAIDNAKVKAALISHCKRQKIKVITIGGAGGKLDPLKIAVSDLSRSWQDPLSAKVRSELRRNYRFSKNPKRRFGVECVYSTEQLLYPNPDGTVSYEKNSLNASVKLDCSQGLGASVSVTATFGMVAASRVINYIVKKDSVGASTN